MSKLSVTLLVVNLCLGHAALHGQGFINIDFQSPNIDPLIFGVDYNVATLFPGWSVIRNGTEYNGGVHYGRSTGEAPLELLRGDVLRVNPKYGAGKYSLSMVPGDDLSFSFKDWRQWRDYELVQTGVVPKDARQFRFVTTDAFPRKGVEVILEKDGRPIGTAEHDPVRWGESGDYYEYDVSGYQGQEITIHLKTSVANGGGYVGILGFSQVPEPTTWAMLAFGGGMLMFCGRRRPV